MLSLEMLLFLYRINKQTLYPQTVSLDLIFSSYSWEESQQAHVPEWCTVLLKYCFFLAFLYFPICISLISLLLPHLAQGNECARSCVSTRSLHCFSAVVSDEIYPGSCPFWTYGPAGGIAARDWTRHSALGCCFTAVPPVNRWMLFSVSAP